MNARPARSRVGGLLTIRAKERQDHKRKGKIFVFRALAHRMKQNTAIHAGILGIWLLIQFNPALKGRN